MIESYTVNDKKVYKMPSRSTSKIYTIIYYTAKNMWSCNCDYPIWFNMGECRHCKLVEFYTKHHPQMIKDMGPSTEIPIY